MAAKLILVIFRRHRCRKTNSPFDYMAKPPQHDIGACCGN